MQQSDALGLLRPAHKKSFQLGHSSGCFFWESREESQTYHTERPQGERHLNREWGLQPISSFAYQTCEWMTLPMIPAPSLSYLSDASGAEISYLLLLCLCSSEGCISRGPETKETYWTSFLLTRNWVIWDLGLQTDASMGWDRGSERRHECILHVGEFELLWPEGRLYRLYFPTCNNISIPFDHLWHHIRLRHLPLRGEVYSSLESRQGLGIALASKSRITLHWGQSLVLGQSSVLEENLAFW